MADLSVHREGANYYLLQGDTDDGRIWLARNVAEKFQHRPDGVVVEPHLLADIIAHALHGGLEVGDDVSGGDERCN